MKEEFEMDKNILETIGGRLRKAREQLGFTLEKAGSLTGISGAYISDFERGKKIPASKYLFKLVTLFGVRLDYIFTGSGSLFYSKKNGEFSADGFGIYKDDVLDMLWYMEKIPGVMFAMLHFFSVYKIENAHFIKKSLDKINGGPGTPGGETAPDEPTSPADDFS